MCVSFMLAVIFVILGGCDVESGYFWSGILNILAFGINVHVWTNS